jgi:methyl-accepting chemotaxis protein
MVVSRWKIGLTLYLVVGLVALVAGGVGFFVGDVARNGNDRIAQIERASSRAVIGERVNGLIYAVVMDSRGIYMATNFRESEKFSPLLLKNLERIGALMRDWTVLAEPEDRAIMSRANARVDEFIKFRTELVRLSRETSLANARVWGDNDANRSNRTALNGEIAALAAADSSRVDKLTSDADSSGNRFLLFLAAAFAAALVAAGPAIVFIRRYIEGPVREFARAMVSLAGGDIGGELPASGGVEEIGEMAQALRLIQGQANAKSQLTAHVTEDVGRVAVAAVKVSSAVSQISNGVHLQLETLKKTATAINKTARAISDMAKNTHLASGQSRNAADMVTDSIQQIKSVIEVVNAISLSGGKIRHVAEVISRIASQTNMLSLNAAIEAGRAGEHGNGFAVVAEEVRKLAEDSTSLAQEISEIVNHAGVQSERSREVVGEVQEKFQRVAESLRQSEVVVGSIAATMEEQQGAVSEVNASLIELTRIGQSTATAGDEVIATMLDLNKLAEQTRGEVEKLKNIRGEIYEFG